MESIEMKIAKTAAENWGQPEPTNLEEAKGITRGSEISSIKGIVSVLGLDPELEEQIVEEVYTQDTISQQISQQIKSKVNNETIIDILSVVHAEWEINNPDNFLRVDKDENGQDKPRNKEYQFTQLEMLSWEEVKSDLLFLKPILEATGAEVDEKSLEQQFEVSQKEFLIDAKNYDMEALKAAFKYYNINPILKGLETKNGGDIRKLLENDEISAKIAEQISKQIDIKSKEELLKEIQESENPLYDELYHVKSDRWYTMNIDETMSKRDILISKLTDGILSEKYVDPIDRGTITYEKVEKDREKENQTNVTPKAMAKAAQKQKTTRGEVKGIKAFFDRMLGRDNRVTENDGRDEK